MQNRQLSGKTALVTGSTSGIGLGIAHALAAEGANIVFNGFGDAAAIAELQQQTASQFGVKTAYSGADMTKPAEIEKMIAETGCGVPARKVLLMPEGTTWTIPAGGFYSWLTLPYGLDATAMLPRAVANLVAYVPGTGFYVDGQGRQNIGVVAEDYRARCHAFILALAG